MNTDDDPEDDSSGLTMEEKWKLGNNTDLVSGIVSENNGCEIMCTSDANCTGLLKCCSNGCGADCVLPAFETGKVPSLFL